MAITQEERKKIEDIIKANNWFTYEEAESQIRKHWKPDNNKKGNYLSTQRRQLQKIIRSDIIGTYFQINDRNHNHITDDEWAKQNIYGFEKEKTYFLDLPNGEEKEYKEKLHVFPKYDDLFPKFEKSIVLSAFDEQLDDERKLQFRDIYEDVYGLPGNGNTKYIMTEPYLFALKHEIERREYPTKVLYCQPDSPKYILQNFEQINFRDELLKNTDHLIDNFSLKIEQELKGQNNVKKLEINRYKNILAFINNWACINPKVLNISHLKNENIYTEFINKSNELKKEFTFNFDSEKEKEKLHKNFSKDKIIHLSDSELKDKIKNSIYSFEKYTLTKLELKLTDENVLLLQAANTRHVFSEFLLKYLKNNNADELIIDAALNAGLH
ncbi:hypothetical protein [Lactobacillus intestinalis]|nr:hypothetical protein [Lactobacillus intestinalis]UTW40343.1 hypothetical protein KBW87_00100 [Lactobacillus intestinalis]